ncbi:MAG: hypothetical protein J6O00_10550 [Clostridiales bacterium]|nr:hypothetical protein [Clostridiales bacterium]
MMSDKNIPNLCQLCNRPLVFGSNPSFFKIIFPDKDDPLYVCKRCCTEYVQTDIHDEDPNLILIDSKQNTPKEEKPKKEVSQEEVPQEEPPKEEKPAVEKKPERYIPPVTKEVLIKQKEEQRKKNEETFWSNLPL